jgi:hypothetical protein
VRSGHYATWNSFKHENEKKVERNGAPVGGELKVERLNFEEGPVLVFEDV